jgi:hypothetical protein
MPTQGHCIINTISAVSPKQHILITTHSFRVQYWYSKSPLISTAIMHSIYCAALFYAIIVLLRDFDNIRDQRCYYCCQPHTPAILSHARPCTKTPSFSKYHSRRRLAHTTSNKILILISARHLLPSENWLPSSRSRWKLQSKLPMIPTT